MTGDQTHVFTPLVAAYVSVWNERDARIRRAIGTQVFTDDVEYVDPATRANGRSAIDAYIAGWQEQFSDMVFELGEIRCHHDLAHFSWSFGLRGRPPVGDGWDVVSVERGRIVTVYGFFGHVPAR